MNDETSSIDQDLESNYYNECLPDSDDSYGSRYISIETYMNKSFKIRSFNAKSHSFLPLLNDDSFASEILVITETWFRTDSTEEVKTVRVVCLYV